MRFRFGDVTMDPDRRGLSRGIDDVHLSPRAYRLLELLLGRRPKAVSREEILDALWPDVVVSGGSIAVLVNEPRKALGDDARSPRWIRTVSGYGYALDGEVQEEDGAPRRAGHSIVWAGTMIALQEGEKLLGREQGMAVSVGHPSVSHRHARVVVSGGRPASRTSAARTGRSSGEKG